MNAIIGMSDLAMKTELTKKQHNYVNKIQISSQALLSLINDILDFSKIELLSAIFRNQNCLNRGDIFLKVLVVFKKKT